MKSIFLFSTMLFLVACSKAKLNQPCTIQFKSDFISSNGNGNDVYSGSMSISRLTFSGSRTEGSDVNIEKEVSDQKIEFEQNSPLGIEMDVPVGVYSNFEAKVRLSKSNSLILRKNLEPQVQKPVIIEITDDLDLLFKKIDKSKEFEKNETYTCVLTWNFFKLFTGFNNLQWSNATSTSIDGVETILINETTNPDLFDLIMENISDAVSAKIE